MPRLQGHRQTSDALLLGLAIKNNAVLVTLDRGFDALAGPQFKANVLLLH
jgi:predicted nucleic acid-binding protein